MQHADRNITKTGKEENLYIHFVGKIKRFHCCTTPIPPVKKSKLVIVKKISKKLWFFCTWKSEECKLFSNNGKEKKGYY